MTDPETEIGPTRVETGSRPRADVLGYTRLPKSIRVIGPCSRQVELVVQADAEVVRPGVNADNNLTVANLAEGTRVLAMHSNRVVAFLGHTSVIDDVSIETPCLAKHCRLQSLEDCRMRKAPVLNTTLHPLST